MRFLTAICTMPTSEKCWCLHCYLYLFKPSSVNLAGKEVLLSVPE
jgi:hypothetical protein